MAIINVCLKFYTTLLTQLRRPRILRWHVFVFMALLVTAAQSCVPRITAAILQFAQQLKQEVKESVS